MATQLSPFVHILDDLVPQQRVAEAYMIFRELPILPGLFYVSLDQMTDEGAVSLLADYLPRSAADFLITHLQLLIEHSPAEALNGADGFEFWVGNKVRTENSAFLHVDNDEYLRHGTGEVRCPIMGSIFHFGPARDLRGGETLFDLSPSDCGGSERQRRLFTWEPWDSVMVHAVAPILVPQRSGRLILFRGDLPHAVAPIHECPAHEPRVTLLANLWKRRISSVTSGVAALSPQEFAAQLKGQGPDSGP